MYIIRTHNKNNQILLFDKLYEAKHWCNISTFWSYEEINQNIERIYKNSQGFYDIFQNN